MMPRGRPRVTETTTTTHNTPLHFRVNWEEVTNARAEPETPLPPVFEPESGALQMEDSIPHYPQMGESRKITRLDIQTAVEVVLEQWAWLAEAGEIDETYWPIWESLGINSKNTLCEYASRRQQRIFRRDRFNHIHCDYCPYVKHYEHKCDSPNEPFRYWLQSNNDRDRKSHAKKFLEKLIVLRKEIILNPDKFK